MRCAVVDPAGFQYNDETAQSNNFTARSMTIVRDQHAAYVATLRAAGVEVELLPSPSAAPDAIFPDWFLTIEGVVYILPMKDPSRRREYQPLPNIEKIIDLRSYPPLEGKGAVVVDVEDRKLYCGLSPRATKKTLLHLAQLTGYTPVWFRTKFQGQPLYHTDVLLALGTEWVVVGEELIDPRDRGRVMSSLAASGRTLLRLITTQVQAYAGNLRVLPRGVLLSQTAFEVLTPLQRETLRTTAGTLYTVDVSEIERIGGGSVNCLTSTLPAKKSVGE